MPAPLFLTALLLAGPQSPGSSSVAASPPDPSPLATPFELGRSFWSAPHDVSSGEIEPYDNLYRRFGFSAGGAFYGDFDTSLRISSPILLGAILDVEDFLGVDSKDSVARFDAFYAFNRRHLVEFAYYDLRRSGTTRINEPIEVGDVVIPAGEIDSFFNTRIFKVNYRYNFVADERTTIAATVGLHGVGLDTGIKSTNFDVEEEFDAIAPLPLVGLYSAYALDHKWTLSAGFQALRVVVGNFDGFVLDSQLNLEHDTFEHFGWGIGFNSFQMNLEIEQSLTADIEYGYAGIVLYLRTYF